MWPQQTAWQRADLWKPAHREKGLCCWWHHQVSRTAWFLGRLLSTFVTHKGNTRVYQEWASQEVLHMPSEQNTIAFVKTEIFPKSLITKARNIAGEDVKGRRQLTNGITFWVCSTCDTDNTELNDTGKGLCIFLWLTVLLSPFSQPGLLVLSVAFISDAARKRKAF